MAAFDPRVDRVANGRAGGSEGECPEVASEVFGPHRERAAILAGRQVGGQLALGGGVQRAIEPGRDQRLGLVVSDHDAPPAGGEP